MQDQLTSTQETVSEKEWFEGYGVIAHSAETRKRIAEMAATLSAENTAGDGVAFYDVLAAGIWKAAILVLPRFNMRICRCLGNLWSRS